MAKVGGRRRGEAGYRSMSDAAGQKKSQDLDRRGKLVLADGLSGRRISEAGWLAGRFSGCSILGHVTNPYAYSKQHASGSSSTKARASSHLL